MKYNAIKFNIMQNNNGQENPKRLFKLKSIQKSNKEIRKSSK